MLEPSGPNFAPHPRGIQRIAFGGNGIGQNFLGGLKEVKTASDMSDGKKAGKCSRVKFFAGKRDGAARSVGACGNLHGGRAGCWGFVW